MNNQKQGTYLEDLNVQQLEAVQETEGPLLVLAGAGTGKTKVLTSRVAHILDKHLAYPSQILVVTFTNKAASEMRQRTLTLVRESIDGMWLGTFHSIAAKVLRRHAEYVGLSNDFTIIDTDDQLRLAKQILLDNGLDIKKDTPKNMLSLIGRFKDKAWDPDDVPNNQVTLFARGKIKELYKEYQGRLEKLNSVDFGDIILHNVRLFNENPDILRQYQAKFKYILVDEYQDTNVAQYLWLRLLAQSSQNICCVGDDDQSIYGWRGAEVTNILRFDKDFPNAKIVRLEANYRSTSNILKAASGLIDNNRNRHGKTLYTSDGVDGNKIQVRAFEDDRSEARHIAKKVIDLRAISLQYSDIAILVRAGFQSRSFEEAFNSLHIPYKIVGGLKFYERAEIRDVIAYLRILINPSDSLALERVINVPRRGVGQTTVAKILHEAKSNDSTYLQAVRLMVERGEIKGKIRVAVEEFFEILERHRLMLKHSLHWEAVSSLLDAVGYIKMWSDEKTQESRERVDNVKELLRSLQDYESLSHYMQHISLVMDSDGIEETDTVNVMTIHAAKGLEFEAVFLAGWEEGVFPSQRSLEENTVSGLEEERRLAYVGITRAKKHLYISYARHRRFFGTIQDNYPSRFLSELPKETYESQDAARNSYVQKAPVARVGSLGFKVGARVRNAKFGEGVVLKIDESAAEVAFIEHGIKKIKLDFLDHI